MTNNIQLNKARVVVLTVLKNIVEERTLCYKDLDNVRKELDNIELKLKSIKQLIDKNDPKDKEKIQDFNLEAGLWLSEETGLLSRIKTLSDIGESIFSEIENHGMAIETDDKTKKIIKYCNKNGYSSKKIQELIAIYNEKIRKENSGN